MIEEQHADAAGSDDRSDTGSPADEVDAEVLGTLMAGLAPVTPSAGVREQLLSRVAQEKTSAPLVPAGTGQEADEETHKEHEDPHGGVVVPLRPRRWRTALVQAAASVVILGVGISIGMGVGRSRTMESMASTENYAHLNQAQDVQRVTDTMPDGHIATLTWSQDMSVTALSLPEEMMSAAPDASLQVWLMKAGETSSLGLYDPASGTGFTFLDLMPEEGETIFITAEPRGGSAQPTGEVLVTFDVRADGTTQRRESDPATGSPAPTTAGESASA